MTTNRKPPSGNDRNSQYGLRSTLSTERRVKAEKALEHYAAGASLHRACKRAGISAPTLLRWTLQDRWLSEQYELARLIASDLRASDIEDCADSALYASKRAGRNRVTGYAAGMEVHPGRERGPFAQKRRITSEIPVVAPAATGSKKV